MGNVQKIAFISGTLILIVLYIIGLLYLQEQEESVLAPLSSDITTLIARKEALNAQKSDLLMFQDSLESNILTEKERYDRLRLEKELNKLSQEEQKKKRAEEEARQAALLKQQQEEQARLDAIQKQKELAAKAKKPKTTRAS